MWIYEGKEFTNTDEWYGFVYLIENLTNGKKYIGRSLKGRHRKAWQRELQTNYSSFM